MRTNNLPFWLLVAGVLALSMQPALAGALYSQIDDGLYTLNKATGERTFIGYTGNSYKWGGDIAFDSAGNLYAQIDDGLYTLNKATGERTYIGYTGNSYKWGGSIAFDASDNLYSQIDDGLYTLNKATGERTYIGYTGNSYKWGGDIAFDSSIPEPGSLVLLSVALFGLLITRRYQPSLV